MLKAKGQVLNFSQEEREFLNKDGVTKVKRTISHILLIVGQDVWNCRTTKDLPIKPVVGKEWETLDVYKYESNGAVKEVVL